MFLRYRSFGFFGGIAISTDLFCVTGVVLPFEPITISFENVRYYVDTPKVLKMSAKLTPYVS